jgi:hypothetical protein
MTTYDVSYSDERGNYVVHNYESWEDAALAFIAQSGDDEYEGFPSPENWDLIGYVTETVAQYGYIVSLPYREDVGHSTVAISYEVSTN